MKLTRDFDSRFESLLLTGRVSKWYSEVGNEATTVPAGLALEAGEPCARCTATSARSWRSTSTRRAPSPASASATPDGRPRPSPRRCSTASPASCSARATASRAASSARSTTATSAPEHGILHVGMISHLGSMIPVAAGCAFALKQRGSDRVAINFIGEGGTSTGDFHEGLNMAAVWKLPLVLVVENNRYAFSTPARLQYAAKQLSDRGPGYGIAGRDRRRQRSRRDGRGLRPRRRARPRRRGSDADRGDARPHARPRRGRRLAEGRAARRSSRATCAADPVPAYAAPSGGRGGSWRSDPRALTAGAAWRGAAIAELVGDRRSPAAPTTGSRLRGRLRRPAIAARSFAPALHAELAAEPAPMAAFAGDGGTARRRDHLPRRHPSGAARGDGARRDGGPDGPGHRRVRGRLPRHPRPARALAASACSTRRSPRAARSASPPAPRSSATGRWSRCSSRDFVSCGFNQLVNVAAKLYYRWQVPCPMRHTPKNGPLSRSAPSPDPPYPFGGRQLARAVGFHAA